MSSFWLPETVQSRPSSPATTVAPGSALPRPASLTAPAERTIASSPASQSHFLISLPPQENQDSNSLLKTSRSRRSFFTNKFKLFKARRTTVSTASDAIIQSSTRANSSAAVEHHPLLDGQSTVPTEIATPSQSPMIGLGLVGLEFDPSNGKYLFKGWSRTPSGGSSYTMDRGGSDASQSSCPSPSTPPFVEISFHGKETHQRKSSTLGMTEAMIGEILKCSIEEMDPADLAGILGVLCQETGIIDTPAWDASLDGSIAEGASPSIESPIAAYPTVCIPSVDSPKEILPRSSSTSVILDNTSKRRKGSRIGGVPRGRSRTTSNTKASGNRCESHERVKAV